MNPAFGHLPERLAEIAEVAGLEAALKLAEHYGGTRVNIPAHAEADGWLARCVGLQAATKICNRYRMHDADNRAIAAQFRLPRGPMGLMRQVRARVARDLQSGQLSVRETARRHGVHENTVFNIRRKLRGGSDEGQGELF